ncbi:HD-GYP domain-containing protein [Acidaminobacter sp. JC074]|uniref:HD-GYP domain-containing protein n=1 Tax=Acidaminobacter sp. JC074 TaxID=2530199 RepID=UPI001F0DA332|nr:HD domain-containing phosphohydrolase [Acidaminobacter sp. JC074]
MVSNIILSEIESFNKVFLEVIDVLVDEDLVKLMSSVLISPDTGEFFMQMDIEYMKALKDMAISEDFRKYRHLTLSDRVLLCPLKKEHKTSETDFEFVLVVYNNNEDIMGLIYMSVAPEKQSEVISSLNNSVNMLLLKNTIEMMCQKYAVYNRLFYSVNSYMEILSVKDKNMPFHTTNVANLCLKMAKKLHLSVLDGVKVYVAALLHDIGKLYVPDDVINNKKKYTYREYEMIKSHAGSSADMAKAEISNLPLLRDVPEIIKCHHEKYDGSGYPDGLKGEEIPFLSRILLMADAVDAMLTPRPYKKQMTRNHVIKELETCKGTHFDPKLVPYMIDVLKETRNRYDIESVVGSNYIHNVALMFFHDNMDEIVTLTGSMIMQKNKGKFFLNQTFDYDIKKVDGAKICFYYLNDIYEYNIHIDRVIGEQLMIGSFKFEPLEEQFALPWRMKTSMYYNRGHRWDAEVIKIGSSSLVMEVAKKYKDEVLEKRREMLTVPIHLRVDEFNEFVEIETKLMQFFDFSEKTVMVAKYLGIKDNKKEALIRGLFKKQIKDRKLL